MPDRETLAALIFETFAAPYGDYLTPALRQQLTISAGLAADAVLVQMERHLGRTVPTIARVLIKRQEQPA